MLKNISKSVFTLGTVLTLILGGCEDANVATSGQNTVVSGTAAIGGAYTLVDHTGKTVTDVDFHGRPQLIYFGFAFCPDICPTALQTMSAALDMASEKDTELAEHYQTMLITIDPERDTPAQLALYVTANGFPKNLVGLTGSPEQIKAVKKTFAVIGNKVEDPSSATGYTYDHSSLIYLMDEKGEFVDVFTHGDTPLDIANRLLSYKETGV